MQKIETDLMALGTPEVPSSAIGEAVLRRLQALDQVAYIRFASVYRQFADIDELRREVEGLAIPETLRTTKDLANSNGLRRHLRYHRSWVKIPGEAARAQRESRSTAVPCTLTVPSALQG